MELTPTQRLLGKTASSIGFIQGLAWSVMSLACIIVYNMQPLTLEEIEKRLLNISYVDFFNLVIYLVYLDKEYTADSPNHEIRRISQKDFNIFMWFYFFVSVALLSASIDLYFAIHQNKNRKSTMMFIWGIVTGMLSFIDLIFTILLFRDLDACPGFNLSNRFKPAVVCQNVTGVIGTIAARGFVLWIVNVIFSATMIYCGIKVRYSVNYIWEQTSIPRVIADRRTPTFPYYTSKDESNWSTQSSFNNLMNNRDSKAKRQNLPVTNRPNYLV